MRIFTEGNSINLSSIFINNDMSSNMNRILFLLVLIISMLHVSKSSAQMILVEAESFQESGGWVIDSQFMDQMGSPYLMAHGLGEPVENAKTTVSFPSKGKYKVWVRTFNWIAPWYLENDGPGAFQLSVNGNLLSTVLGTKGTRWMWQEAGVIDVSKIQKKNKLKDTKLDVELVDLTGFNGRVDALLFSDDLNYIPSNDTQEVNKLRNKLLPKQTINEGDFDFVVVGGGTAGMTAALAAARLGLKVALINNRPVLGGNNSSEIRVGLNGKMNANFYPKIGNLLRELTGIPIPQDSHQEEGYLHPPRREASKEVDKFRENILRNEPNLSLFLNIHVNQVQMDGNAIVAVSGKDVATGNTHIFSGTYFSDCTGDATIGFLAGADYRMGRETYYEAFESKAPLVKDNHKMGTTLLWRSTIEENASSFPIVPWAAQVSKDYFIDNPSGSWKWESGFKDDTIEDAEFIRDNLLRAIFGNWSFLKNQLSKYPNYKLGFVPYIGGKRESRRLLGDVILNEHDLINMVDYPDKSYTTSWSIDLHYEDEENSKHFPGNEWQSYCIQPHLAAPYTVPYRTLYSRNIKNLFMAGRNVSVTHIALGTVRVMGTTAMMGEVVGMAATICVQNDAYPRDVYEKYLGELQQLMSIGIPTKEWDKSVLPHELPIWKQSIEW